MPDTEHDPRSSGYEPDDLNVRRLLATIGVVLAVLAFVMMVGYWLTGWYSAGTAGATAGAEPVAVSAPEPHLQPRPQPDLWRHRAAKRSQLNGYHWVDRQTGVVRIPIDRAMELYVQRAGKEGGGS